MDVTPYRHTESITVQAPPEAVYDLVADISRMGEWSPVSTGGRWDEDRTWFTGTNAIGSTTWATRCKVVAAAPGREFTFINHGEAGNHEMVRWAFTLAPVGGGTELTQHWEVLPGYVDGFAEETDPGMTLTQRLDLMQVLARKGMPETLDNIRKAAEA
jgi:uncharacterized protein YndB with AHSA1/START domain